MFYRPGIQVSVTRVRLSPPSPVRACLGRFARHAPNLCDLVTLACPLEPTRRPAVQFGMRITSVRPRWIQRVASQDEPLRSSGVLTTCRIAAAASGPPSTPA
jgi:hypothetical protein